MLQRPRHIEIAVGARKEQHASRNCHQTARIAPSKVQAGHQEVDRHRTTQHGPVREVNAGDTGSQKATRTASTHEVLVVDMPHDKAANYEEQINSVSAPVKGAPERQRSEVLRAGKDQSGMKEDHGDCRRRSQSLNAVQAQVVIPDVFLSPVANGSEARALSTGL